MNQYQKDVHSTFKEAWKDLGKPMLTTTHGKVVPCLPKFERWSTLIEIGGNPVVIDMAVLVSSEYFITFDSTEVTFDSDITFDDMSPVPKSGELVTYLGRSYKVLQRGWAPARTHVRFELVDPHSGR
jgi:hypothetical protein